MHTYILHCGHLLRKGLHTNGFLNFPLEMSVGSGLEPPNCRARQCCTPFGYGYTRGQQTQSCNWRELHWRMKAESPAALPPRSTAWNTDITENKNLMFTVSKTSVGSDLFSFSADVVVINRNSQGTLGAALAEIIPLTS